MGRNVTDEETFCAGGVVPLAKRGFSHTFFQHIELPRTLELGMRYRSQGNVGFPRYQAWTDVGRTGPSPLRSTVDIDTRTPTTECDHAAQSSIVDHVRRRRDDWPTFKEWTESEVKRYVTVGHPKWAKAVEKGLKLSAARSPLTFLD
ncbi:MAG: hypothetical protein AAFY29_18055 [Pseudomonadota bacterium]